MVNLCSLTVRLSESLGILPPTQLLCPPNYSTQKPTPLKVTAPLPVYDDAVTHYREPTQANYVVCLSSCLSDHMFTLRSVMRLKVLIAAVMANFMKKMLVLFYYRPRLCNGSKWDFIVARGSWLNCPLSVWHASFKHLHAAFIHGVALVVLLVSVGVWFRAEAGKGGL